MVWSRRSTPHRARTELLEEEEEEEEEEEAAAAVLHKRRRRKMQVLGPNPETRNPKP